MIEKESMEQHVQQYNRQSFSAASESPCGHGLLHDTLTFTSFSPEAQKILDTGLCSPEWPSLHPLLDEFFASFIIPDSVKMKKTMAASPLLYLNPMFAMDSASGKKPRVRRRPVAISAIIRPQFKIPFF
jgi:hypothetical protein